MAKLNKEQAKRVAAAENGFEALPEGWYHLRLRDVDSSRTGPKGPYWVWEYEVVGSDDGKGLKRRLWNNTSLSEAAAGVFKATFDAFGVPTDVDTDDLCGRVIKAQVVQVTIQQGQRAGQLGNQIQRLVPADDDFVVPEELASGSGSSDSPDPDDIFG